MTTTTRPDNVAQFGLHRLVAANVRAEVARQQLSQTQLAAALGLSQQLVSNRLKGKTPFTIDEIDVVARVLRLELLDLFARRSTREPRPDGPGGTPQPGENTQPQTYGLKHYAPRGLQRAA